MDDHATDEYSKEELSEALRAISSLVSKCEKVRPKLRPGSAQLTLLRNRIKALRVAEALIKKELAE